MTEPVNHPRTAQPRDAHRRSTRRLAALLLASLAAASPWAPAQEKTSMTAEAKRLVGSWGYSSSDKETGDTETTVVQFKDDGTYVTFVRSTAFPEQGKQPLARGRYAVGEADKSGMTVVLERTAGDPEDDKNDATAKVRLAIVDDNTLRADDGSVATRTK